MRYCKVDYCIMYHHDLSFLNRVTVELKKTIFMLMFVAV